MRDLPKSARAKSTIPEKRSRGIKRWGPLILLLAVLCGFFIFGLNQRLTLDELALNYAGLSAFVAENTVVAILGMIVIYLVAVAASFPAAWLLTVAIGLVFGWVTGAAIVVVGATLGASLLFLAARFLLFDFFRRKAGERVQLMAEGFRHNAVNYMLFLRLAPIFPFLLVNVVPAIVGVRFSTYFWTTAIGIVPGTIAYAFAGEGLRSIISARADACIAGISPCGEPFSGADIITAQMLTGLTLLALVSVLPVLVKQFMNK